MSEQKQVVKKTDLSDHRDDFIVETMIIKKGVPIGDDGSVSIVEEVIEAKKYNRQEYINSFRDEVGVLNILKKVNAGLINPATVAASFDLKAPINDVCDIPTDVGDALALVDEAHKLYAKLPADLKAGMDFNTFVKSFDQAKFDAYIASQKKVEEKKDE